jgi:hypothetical protein
MSSPHATMVGSTVHEGAQRHIPPSQLVRGAQRFPQAPQWSLSLARLTQRLSQKDNGAGQRHVPPSQTVPGGQIIPHAPQLALSKLRSTHPPPQAMRPGAHIIIIPPSPSVHSPTH